MLKTLLLNPPSYQGFDGGAGSRWPATREIFSFWYPVWLCYPAGMIPESRVLDASPAGYTAEQTLEVARDYELVVIFTNTPSIKGDLGLAERMKQNRPDQVIALVGPHVSVLPEESLQGSPAVDVVCRGEFDYTVLELAQEKGWDHIQGISYRRNGQVVHNPDRPAPEDLDALPFVTPIYKRDLDVRQYNLPFLRYPYMSFYTARGCPNYCTFCLWPQTFSGRQYRWRSVANVLEEVKQALRLFPEVKEFFFDDDTFTIRKDRVRELTEALGPLNFTWSCNARAHNDYETLKMLKDAGCRLVIVGFESGSPQILRNIKKGITVEQGLRFAKDCKRLGLKLHADFIVGLPGETPETVEQSIQFARQLDPDTVQVSIAHAFPGTELYQYLKENGYYLEDQLLDDHGFQLANINYPQMSRLEIFQALERFYRGFYYRPRIIARIIGRAMLRREDRTRLWRESREFLSFLRKRKQMMGRMEAGADGKRQPATGKDGGRDAGSGMRGE